MPAIAHLTISALPADSGDLAHKLAAVLGAAFVRRRVTLLDSPRDPARRWASLARAQVVIVIIGPWWTTLLAQSPEGAMVRAELAALLRDPAARLILPVLAPGVAMPAAASLPPEFQPLVYVQAVRLSAGPEQPMDPREAVAAIKEYTRRIGLARREKGNFIWYKVLSALPVATFALFSIATLVFSNKPIEQLTPAQSLIALGLSLLVVVAVVAVWITGAVLAFATRRPRWGIINAFSLPLALAFFGAVAVIVESEAFKSVPHALTVVIIGIALLILLCGLFAWPIIFAVTLPPHRRRAPAGS